MTDAGAASPAMQRYAAEIYRLQEGNLPELRDGPLVDLDPAPELKISRVRAHNLDKLR